MKTEKEETYGKHPREANGTSITALNLTAEGNALRPDTPTDEDGNTALAMAAMQGRTETVSYVNPVCWASFTSHV